MSVFLIQCYPSESYGGYASRAQPVKKVDNFFDDDDDVDDFETFENDKDFAKMKMSLNENDKNAFQNTAEEDLGRAWGGETYSLKQG